MPGSHFLIPKMIFPASVCCGDRAGERGVTEAVEVKD
jgi:hypothetical protein